MSTQVIRLDNDLDGPLRGLVIGWEDEDRCLVLWGDAWVEWADKLTPYSR